MFLRKKKIGKNEYYYLVRSTRIKGKIKKFERYVGRKKPNKKDLKFYEKESNQIKLILNQNKDFLEKIKNNYLKKIKTATKDELNKIEENLIIDFTYNTDRIEGSALSREDTFLLLKDNITPNNKPLRDIKEAENHKQACLYLKNNLNKDINKELILKLHEILKKNITEDAGKFRDRNVSVGDLIPIKANLIEEEINNLIDWYNKNKDLHTLELAAIFHCNFEKIHPFFDGNGRIGRLLMNFILLKERFPLIIIQNKNRRRYYRALRKADDGDYSFILKYLISEVKNQYK